MISVCRRTEATWKKATDSKFAIRKCRSSKQKLAGAQNTLEIRSEQTRASISTYPTDPPPNPQ